MICNLVRHGVSASRNHRYRNRRPLHSSRGSDKSGVSGIQRGPGAVNFPPGAFHSDHLLNWGGRNVDWQWNLSPSTERVTAVAFADAPAVEPTKLGHCLGLARSGDDMYFCNDHTLRRRSGQSR
jgi:hypothetical protein